jgi:DNA-binding GntR family transcriptional regulator
MPRRPRRSQKQTHKPPESGTTADAVYEALRKRIVEGEFAPGQRLRSDALATSLKVSRTPVREALRKLEAEGLVGLSPRGGLIVQTLSEEDLNEIFLIREALEGLAARLAAENATPNEMAELHILIEDMESSAGRGELNLLRALTGEFHRHIAQASHNKRLAQSLKALQDRVRQVQLSTLFLDDRPTAAIEEHRSLVRAIEARDGDRAESLARSHRRQTLILRQQMIRDQIREGRLAQAREVTEEIERKKGAR